MEALITENNILTIIELVEWRRTIMDLEDEGENVSSEMHDFKSKLAEFIENLKSASLIHHE